MKKAIQILIFTLYPLLLSAIYTFFASLESIPGGGLVLVPFFVVCYILPFCALFYFIKKRPFNQWILFVGFIPVPLLPFIYEYLYPGWFQYLVTVVTVRYYTIPFVVLFLIAALVISIKDKRVNKHE